MSIKKLTIGLILSLLLNSGITVAADFNKGLKAVQSGDFKTALAEWTPLAEHGHAPAQYSLGIMYANGNGVPQNEKTSVNWYTLSAEQGYDMAQYNLALMYDYGKGILENDQTAVKWYIKAAEQGHAQAQYNLGLMYAKGNGVPQNDKTAEKWWSLAAEKGVAEAQYNLGIMYANGNGVPENDKTAVKWFTLAAEQGDAKAQFNLGVKYANGNGVPENDKIAVNWYTKAAEQGNDRAQNNLGNMYANGNGVPENDKIAVRWFTKAAEQGHVKAKFNLGLCRIMAMVFSQTIDVPMCGMKWPLILRNLSYGEDVSTDNSVTMTLPEAIDYVRQEVSNNWISPDNSREGTVTLEVKLSPTGRIIDVSVMSRDASDEFVDSVIEALRKVGSFEKLANLDRKLFDKNFRRFPLRFKPEDLR